MSLLARASTIVVANKNGSPVLAARVRILGCITLVRNLSVVEWLCRSNIRNAFSLLFDNIIFQPSPTTCTIIHIIPRKEPETQSFGVPMLISQSYPNRIVLCPSSCFCTPRPTDFHTILHQFPCRTRIGKLQGHDKLNTLQSVYIP